MRLFYSVLSFVFFGLICISCTQKKDITFSIQGSITPVNTDHILLKREADIERKISTIVDTIYLNKEGKFSADYDLEPYLYTLHFNDSTSLALAIDKGQHVKVEVSNLNLKEFKTKITGSKDAEALLAYETFREKSLDILVKSIRRQIKELKKADQPNQIKIDSLSILEVENYDLHLTELNNYIKNNMVNTLGLYATSIRWKGPENFNFYDSIVANFEAAHPDLSISKRIREKVRRLRQTAIGGKVKDISMPIADGSLVSLSSLNSKYILIDFWASWCGPCRRESPALNALINKYTKEDFDIYGVSLDDNKEKWLRAIEKDNRGWTNVSSLERFKTRAAYDYAVTALPDNYLIDTERKIIAKNIHGEKLEVLLKELFNKD